MIYFLAEDLDGKDGGSRAAADFLRDLVELQHPVVVVSRRRHSLPRRSDGGPPPRVRWLLVPLDTPLDWKGLGVSPRNWLWRLRTKLHDASRRLRAVVVPRLVPPTLAIHNEFPYPGSCAHGILHMAPRRMIIVHTSSDQIAYFLRRRKTLTPALVSAEMEKMQGLLFVSPQLQDDWGRIADISGIRQWVVSNTCREEEAAAVLARSRDEIRASLELPPGAFVAVCVGYVHDGKGQDTLIDALPGMIRTTPGLLVVFVGNDSSEWAAALKRRISETGLAGHVRFAGLRSDPYAFIRAADLMIHPSRAEGQGIVLLEATLLRTPVLATDVGGIPSVITHGETGWLVPANDPDALVEGFRTLAGDPELRSALVERAERSYWTRFHSAEHRRQVGAVVMAMLSGA